MDSHSYKILQLVNLPSVLDTPSASRCYRLTQPTGHIAQCLSLIVLKRMHQYPARFGGDTALDDVFFIARQHTEGKLDFVLGQRVPPVIVHVNAIGSALRLAKRPEQIFNRSLRLRGGVHVHVQIPPGQCESMLKIDDGSVWFHTGQIQVIPIIPNQGKLDVA